MDIPPGAWAPAGAVLVAVIGVLGTLLVRERRRNGNHQDGVTPGNPGPGMPPVCVLADEHWKGRFEVLAEELQGIRYNAGKVLERLDTVNTNLAVLIDRGRLGSDQ